MRQIKFDKTQWWQHQQIKSNKNVHDWLAKSIAIVNNKREDGT